MKHLILALLSVTFARMAAQPIGVDPAFPVYQPSAPLHGTLTTIGSDSVAQAMRRWAEILHAAHPDVHINIEPKGSDLSAQALIDGHSQFAYSGRPMPDNEIAAITKAWGHPPLRILVSGSDFTKKDTTHPQVVWVNAKNPLRQLTLTQVDAIFSESRKRGASKSVTTWGELGLTGEWADAPIHKYVIKTSGGPAIYLKEAILVHGDWDPAIKEMREEKIVPEGVAIDPLGIGLTGLPYGSPEVRALALAVSAGAPFVEPTLPNVFLRAYPLSRVNYLYVNKPPGKPLDPVVKELLRVVLSRQGQEAAMEAHYLPLSADLLFQELAMLD